MKIKILLFVVFYIIWVLVALYFSFGLFSSSQSDGNISPISIGVYIVAIMVPIFLFNRWLTGEPGWMKTVRADGKQARATVLSVGGGGFQVNRRVLWTIKLRVEPLGEEPFEVKLEKLSWLPSMIEGQQVQVKYDPDHHNHVVVGGDADMPQQRNFRPTSAASDSGDANLDPELQELMRTEAAERQRGISPSRANNISDQLAELAQLHKNGDLTDAEFENAKKKLLG